MRLVYVCKSCGHELVDSQVKSLAEHEFTTLTEAEAEEFRRKRQTSGMAALREVKQARLEDRVGRWAPSPVLQSLPQEDFQDRTARWR